MKFDSHKLRQDFSRAASTYDRESSLQRTVLDTLLLWVKEDIASLQKEQRVLDAGCGTGYLAAGFVALQNKASLIGCDLAMGMCQKASEHVGFSSIVNATVEHLPFADKSFASVISSLTLQWVNDPLEALYEWHRVTDAGGFIHLTTFGTHTLKEMKNVFSMLDDEVHVSPFHAAPQLVDMLKTVGYEDIQSNSQIYRQFMPSFLVLAKHLKAIGATNKRTDRAKRMMSHQQLTKLDEFYHLFYSQPEGLPVTWEVHYLRARKPKL